MDCIKGHFCAILSPETGRMQNVQERSHLKRNVLISGNKATSYPSTGSISVTRLSLLEVPGTASRAMVTSGVLTLFDLCSNPRRETRETIMTPTLCMSQDFPGGPLVTNLPCNAGDVGLIPAFGTKIPHAMEQLNQCPQLESPCATTSEALVLRSLHVATKT